MKTHRYAALLFACCATLARATSLTWDANGTGTGQTDGAGTWLNVDQWWDGAANQTWVADSNAIIGNAGAGGAITVGNVSAGTVLLDNFTGTYTLQGTGTTLTQSGGITIGAGAGNVTFKGTGASPNNFTVSGAGGITMNDSGLLSARENIVLSYTGPTVINSGTVMFFGNLPAGSNFTLNNGMATDYYRSTHIFANGLGTGAGQVQVYGDSGFGSGNGNGNWRIGSSGSTLIWGALGEGSATGYFNPTSLKLRSTADNNGTTIYGQITLQNKLDLNGAARTINVLGATGYNAPINGWGKVDAGIEGIGGSLIKTGEGKLIFGNAANTYDGGTTVNEGIIQYDRSDQMPSTGNHDFNDGTGLWLKVGGSNQFTAASSGAGSLGGLLTGTGPGSSNTNFSGTVDLALYPSGSPNYAGPLSMTGGTMGDLWIIDGGMTLSGTGTYTGSTMIGRIGGSAITVTLGSNTALPAGTPVVVDTSGSSALDLNGFNATIGKLTLGSNNGGARGQVADTAGTGTLTLTDGVFCDDHNNGNGGISAGFLDLNGTTQIFQVRDGTQASDLLVTSVVQNGSLTMTGLETNATMELAGACTYTGGTQVTNGKLTVSGSLADASMTISGGTVNGSGSLTVNINGTTADQIVVTGGTFDATGLTLNVNPTGSGLTQAEYVLVNATGSGTTMGSFAGMTGAAGYQLYYGVANQIKLITDTDGDGFPDTYELLHTDPPTATALNREGDRDTDGVNNWDEYQNGTNPSLADTDGDKLLDGGDVTVTSADPRYTQWATDGIVHTDNGGDRTFRGESQLGSDPLNPDTDDDGLPDGVESGTGVWVSSTDTGTDPHNPDTDRDGFTDKVETSTGIFVSSTNTGTNPNHADTDNDGAGDWYEITASLTSPFIAAEKPNIPYPLPDPDSSVGATNKPVKVYIMSGQSNMVGAGTVSGTGDGTLETMIIRQNKFPDLINGSGAWTTRQDVRYRGVISDTGKVQLSPGTLGSTIGPELGFGYVMGWYHDEPVLLLKSSIGNRALGWDILPPGSTTYQADGYQFPAYGETPEKWTIGSPITPWTPGAWYAGYEWDRFFMDESEWIHPHAAETNVVDVLDNWVTEYPDWKDQGFQIAGFVWWQGDRDRYTMGHANRYEQNLVNLINSLRNYYTNRYPGKVVANAPFVLATLGQTAIGDTSSAADKAILDAQLAVDGTTGNYPQYAGNVKTVYAHPLSEGGASNSHYNNRAGTYMLVGDALGRAMVSLEAGATPTGFAAWQAANSATGQTPADDHDGDGVPNGIEWFVMGSDNSTGFTALPGVDKDPGTGALSITWTKNAAFPGAYGTDFVIESSETLTGTWTAETSPGTVTLTGNQVKYTFPTPLGGKKFARLRVVVATP